MNHLLHPHSPHTFYSHLWHAVLVNGHYLGTWCYVILALLVMVEGPMMTLLGAGAAAAGLLRPQFVFLSAGMGNLAGDLLWYSLGRLGKTEWLLRYGRFLGLSREKINDMQNRMRAYAPRIIFVAKLTLFFMIPTLVAAGITRTRLRRWFPVDILAECIWTGSLVTVGYYLSQYIKRLETGLQIIAFVGMLISVFGLIAIIKHYGARWGQPQAEGDEKTSTQASPPLLTKERQGREPRGGLGGEVSPPRHLSEKGNGERVGDWRG